MTILLPLDGSALAEMAIPYAIDAARRDNEPILLFRAVPFPPVTFAIEPAVPGYIYADELQAEQRMASEYLDAKAAELRDTGIEVTTTQDIGDAGTLILAAARASQAKLIVLATHGRSGISRWFYGSVAEAVLRGSSVPVMLIPAGRSVAKEPVKHEAVGAV